MNIYTRAARIPFGKRAALMPHLFPLLPLASDLFPKKDARRAISFIHLTIARAYDIMDGEGAAAGSPTTWRGARRNMEKILQISHLSKTYGKGKKAVDDLSLDVYAGDIYGFIGQNGAGKTTTLRAVTGILEFDEGEITICGNSVKQKPVQCKQVTAYIPDNPDLYEYLTGIQYLNFMGDMFGVETGVRKERIERYAAMFRIEGDLGSLISSYSHGMKQKLAIIGALLHEPKLMVLDEPFVGLDPEAAFKLKQVFRDMCAAGSAIFFSTHVLDVAEKLCNKIAIIKQGKLMASGDIDAVRGDESLESVFMEVLEKDAR